MSKGCAKWVVGYKAGKELRTREEGKYFAVDKMSSLQAQLLRGLGFLWEPIANALQPHLHVGNVIAM